MQINCVKRFLVESSSDKGRLKISYKVYFSLNLVGIVNKIYH